MSSPDDTLTAIPAAQPPHPVRHFPTLDGLRGAAVLLVFFHHCLWLPSTTVFDRAVGTVIETGWTGVDLFFVLSGFLITGILLDTRTSPGYFRNFICRRALRIFPLYLATLIVFFWIVPIALGVLAPHSRLQSRFAELGRDQVWYWLYLQNWYYVQLNAWPSAGHLSHTWSLAIEEQFYIVWPLIVWLSGRRSLALICLLGVIAGPVSRFAFLASGTSWIPPYVATCSRLDPLCLGALAALLTRSRAWRWNIDFTAGVLAASSLVLAGALHLSTNYLVSSNTSSCLSRHTLLGLGFTSLLIVALRVLPGTVLYRVLAHPGLVIPGKYSYGIYVIHWPVCHLLAKLPLTWLPGVVRPWVFLLACGVITGLLAFLSMTFLEQPFLKLKKYFEPATAKLSSPGPGPARASDSDETASALIGSA